MDTLKDEKIKRLAKNGTPDMINEFLLNNESTNSELELFLENANDKKLEQVASQAANLKLNLYKNVRLNRTIENRLNFFIETAKAKQSQLNFNKDKQYQLNLNKEVPNNVNVSVAIAVKKREIEQLAKHGSSEDIYNFLDQTVLSLDDVKLFLTSSTPTTLALFKSKIDPDQSKRFAVLIDEAERAQQATLQFKKVSPGLKEHRDEIFKDMSAAIAYFKGPDEKRKRLVSISLELGQQEDLTGMAQKVREFGKVQMTPTPVEEVSVPNDGINLARPISIPEPTISASLQSKNSSISSSSSSVGGEDSSFSSATPEQSKRSSHDNSRERVIPSRLKKLRIEDAPVSPEEERSEVMILARLGDSAAIKFFLSKIALRQEDIKLFLDNANPTQLELFIKYASDVQIQTFSKMANQLGILTFLAKATTAQIVIFSKNADDNQVELFLNNAKEKDQNLVTIFIKNANDNQMQSFARHADQKQINFLRNEFKDNEVIINKFEAAVKIVGNETKLPSLKQAPSSSSLSENNGFVPLNTPYDLGNEVLAPAKISSEPADYQAHKKVSPELEEYRDKVFEYMRAAIADFTGPVDQRAKMLNKYVEIGQLDNINAILLREKEFNVLATIAPIKELTLSEIEHKKNVIVVMEYTIQSIKKRDNFAIKIDRLQTLLEEYKSSTCNLPQKENAFQMVANEKRGIFSSKSGAYFKEELSKLKVSKVNVEQETVKIDKNKDEGKKNDDYDVNPSHYI